MIYITVKSKHSEYTLQNKVAVSCDNKKENILEVAKSAFTNICLMEKVNEADYTYSIYIENFGNFFLLV